MRRARGSQSWVSLTFLLHSLLQQTFICAKYVLVGNRFKGEHFLKKHLVLWGEGHCVLGEWGPDARGQKEEPQVVRGYFPEGVALELGSDGRVGAGWAKMREGAGGRESSNTERTAGTTRPPSPAPVFLTLASDAFHGSPGVLLGTAAPFRLSPSISRAALRPSSALHIHGNPPCPACLLPALLESSSHCSAQAPSWPHLSGLLTAV